MKEIKGILGEFKKFVMKGNVIDLAVGLVVGASFSKIVSSLVADLIMPLVGLLMGKVNFTNLFFALDFNSYETLELAKKANAPLLTYGNFLQTVVDFIIIGFAIFLVVKLANKAQAMAKLKEEQVNATVAEVLTKECPACAEKINKKAILCPHCRTAQQ